MAEYSKRTVQGIFKNYKRMNRQLKTQLKDMGLNVQLSKGNHWKIMNKQSGRCVYIPLTPSDWRAGRNVAKYVSDIL